VIEAPEVVCEWQVNVNCLEGLAGLFIGAPAEQQPESGALSQVKILLRHVPTEVLSLVIGPRLVGCSAVCEAAFLICACHSRQQVP
jgi:hypothetical protein